MSRPLLALLFTTGLMAACADDLAVVPDPVAPRGTLYLELHSLNPRPDDLVVVWDVDFGPDAGGAVTTRRVAGTAAETRTTLACDPDLNPYTVSVTVVGVYEVAPAVLGDYGDPAPEGALIAPDLGPLTRTVTCVADLETPVQFDVSVVPPAQQGFLDLAVNLSAELVRESLVDFRVEEGFGEHLVVWQQRVRSAEHGNTFGSLSYTGPCSAAGPDRAGSANLVTADLVGVYAREVGAAVVGYYGDPAPPDALESWPLGKISRNLPCLENRDVFHQFDVALARVVREAGAIQAGVAGLVCDATSSCGADGAPTLRLDCAGPSTSAPAVYLAELGLRCGDGAPVPLDSTAAHAPFRVEPDGDGLRLLWELTPALDPERLTQGPCTLEARVTVDAATSEGAHHRRQLLDGALPANAVVPFFTWSVPVADATGPACTAAALALDGPVRVTYSGTEPTPRQLFLQWWSAAP